MFVDVVMCTFNSNKPYFRNVLYAIKQNLNINKFIVVDKFSNDGTIDVVQEIFPDALIIQSDKPLSIARKIGIQHVETDIFMFIDSDIEITRDYVVELFKHINENDVGAVHGYAFQKWIWNVMKELYNMYKYPDVIDVTKEDPDRERGCTIATLIKTDIVRDWNPLEVRRLEDHLLLRHVVSKGFKWRILPKTWCVHHVGVVDSIRKMFVDSAYMRKIGFKPMEKKLKTIKLLATTPCQAVKLTIKTKSIIPIWYLPLIRLVKILGYHLYCLVR